MRYCFINDLKLFYCCSGTCRKLYITRVCNKRTKEKLIQCKALSTKIMKHRRIKNKETCDSSSTNNEGAHLSPKLAEAPQGYEIITLGACWNAEERRRVPTEERQGNAPNDRDNNCWTQNDGNHFLRIKFTMKLADT